MLSRTIYKKQRGRRLLTVLAAVGLLSGTLIAGSAVLANVPNADFELEGNTLDAAGTPGDDWATLYTDVDDAGANFDGFSFVNDKTGTTGDVTYWTGGGSKDRNDIAQWQFSTGDSSPDKNDIVNSFAAIYRDGNDSLFFGADRFAVNGDAQMAFWFLSQPICLSGITTGSIVCPSTNPGKFLDPNTGAVAHHADGDLLVVVNFNNGGTLGLAGVYVWQGGIGGAPVQVLVGTGAECKSASPESLDFCSTSNTGNLTTEPIWPYTAKGGGITYKTSAFIEGGIDLDSIPGVAACFPTFIAETRSSSGPSTGLSLDAQLKDLSFGQFELCRPSTSLGASPNATVQPGGSTELSFTETNDGNEDLEDVSLTVDNGCTVGAPTGDDTDPGILNEGEAWVFTCTVSPTSTTTYTAYAVGTGVDSGILVTGNPTCTPSSSVFCSEAERAEVTVTVVDAYIELSPLTDTNEVNDDHDITATVYQNDGSGGGFTFAPDGTTVDFSLLNNNNGADFVPAGADSCTTTGGSCTITINTSDTGDVDIHATTTFSVGGLSLTRSTDATGSNTGDANKVYVDASITIAPDATNPVGEPHTFTVTVSKDIGDGAGFVAAAGEHVDFTLTDGGDAVSVLDAASSTCDDAGANTDSSGQCTIVFVSDTPGTVTGHASVTVTIDGVAVVRQTDGLGNNSDDAVKTYITGAIKILKNSTKGGPVLIAGAVFSVEGDLLPAGFQVIDNGANDGDDTIGVICVGGVTPGSNYTVNEVTAPTGYGDATEEDLVAVGVSGTCETAVFAAANTVTFVNAPLFDIQVNFRDGGSGETSITSITCDANSALDDPATDGWDASQTNLDVEFVNESNGEMTIVCTLVVDP